MGGLMASAAFSIGGGSSLAMYSATAAEVVTIALDSTDGVRSSSVSVIAADDSTATTDWTIASSTATSTTITCPNAEGCAALIEWRVNGGSITGADGQTTSGDLVKRAKIAVPASNGGIVIVPGETYETNGTYGWAGEINDVIRSGGGGGSGDIEGVTAGAGLTGGGTTGTVSLAVAAADSTITVNADSIQVGAINTVNINDGVVTLAKLANLSQGTVMGRAVAAGTGIPTALSTAQQFALTQAALAAGTSALDVNAQRITDVADPTAAQDAVTLAYLQANAPAVYTRSGTIDFSAAQSWADLGASFSQTASTARVYEIAISYDHAAGPGGGEGTFNASCAAMLIRVLVWRNSSNVAAFVLESGLSFPLDVTDGSVAVGASYGIDVRLTDDSGSWKIQVQKGGSSNYTTTATVNARIIPLSREVPWTSATSPGFSIKRPTSGSYTAGDGLTLTGSDFDIDLTDTTVFSSTATASRAVVRDASGDTAVRYLTAERINGTSNTVQINGSTEVETNCGVYDVNATGAATLDAASIALACSGVASLVSTGLGAFLQGSSSCYLQAGTTCSLNGADVQFRVTNRRSAFQNSSATDDAIVLAFPASVTPAGAGATAVGTLTVQASSAGRFTGSLVVRNGSTNAKTFPLDLSWNDDGTTATVFGLTVGTQQLQGTIGTVAGDVATSVSGHVITITVANASGFKCAARGAQHQDN